MHGRAFTPDAENTPHTEPQSLLRAAMTNALNRWLAPYLFWSLVLGPLIVTTWRENPLDAVSIVLALFFAMIGLNIAVVLLFGQAARFGNQMRRAMLGLSVLALAGFGLFPVVAGDVCAVKSCERNSRNTRCKVTGLTRVHIKKRLLQPSQVLLLFGQSWWNNILYNCIQEERNEIQS